MCIFDKNYWREFIVELITWFVPRFEQQDVCLKLWAIVITELSMQCDWNTNFKYIGNSYLQIRLTRKLPADHCEFLVLHWLVRSTVAEMIVKMVGLYIYIYKYICYMPFILSNIRMLYRVEMCVAHHRGIIK